MRLLLAFLLVLSVAAAAPARAADSPDRADDFRAILDAYFGDEPNRAIVLARDFLEGRRTVLREPALYVLGQAFASIHLYEKAEDSFHTILVEYPDGAFAPRALRALARIFFDLREYEAVVLLDSDSRKRLPESRIDPEVWYLLGESQYLLGNDAKARGLLGRVPPGTAFRPFAEFTLAQADFRLGQSGSALDRLRGVAGSSASSVLLRDNAIRTSGMILYQEGRYRQAIEAFDQLGERSRLYPVSRIDIALAAEAAEDPDRVRAALEEAMNTSDDGFLRAEARVAFGRLFNRGGDAAAARALFEQAISEIHSREQRLRHEIDSPGAFRTVFDELVTFARESRTNQVHKRRQEDLELLRAAFRERTGATYTHEPPAEGHDVTPGTGLFRLLHDRFHAIPIIESIVDLTVEIQDLRDGLEALRHSVSARRRAFYEQPPVVRAEIPERLSDAFREAIWLLLSRFDLYARVYNELVVNERMPLDPATEAKRNALTTTFEGLYLVKTGRRSLPSAGEVESMLERAASKIRSGAVEGAKSRTIQEAMLGELRADRRTFLDLVSNLQLKERQMTAAIAGIPLRSRNLNMPILTTVMQWLEALEQLDGKYSHVGIGRDDRPWHLAGRGDDIDSYLRKAIDELVRLEERAFEALRQEAKSIVDRERTRHSLILAQAEEGMADALYQERDER